MEAQEDSINTENTRDAAAAVIAVNKIIIVRLKHFFFLPFLTRNLSRLCCVTLLAPGTER